MRWASSFNVNKLSPVPILGINVKAYYSHWESVGKSFHISIQISSNFDS